MFFFFFCPNLHKGFIHIYSAPALQTFGCMPNFDFMNRLPKPWSDIFGYERINETAYEAGTENALTLF